MAENTRDDGPSVAGWIFDQSRNLVTIIGIALCLIVFGITSGNIVEGLIFSILGIVVLRLIPALIRARK